LAEHSELIKADCPVLNAVDKLLGVFPDIIAWQETDWRMTQD
jgi:hypothetical protein